MAAPTVGDDALILTDIGVRFGGLTALDGVSLRVPAGQVVGVIGPNGAGKTTLFNVVCGFVRRYAGTMSLFGVPLRPRPQALTGYGIARTMQGLGLFSGLSTIENVMLGANCHARAGFVPALFGLPRSDRDEQALRAAALATLTELGIDKYAAAVPASLPYAVRKKVALARALAGRPRLLLLDEPAGGLSADEIADLATLIRDLPQRDQGCTVILVEHHMDLVMQVCDQVVALDFGKLIAAGDPATIQNDPAVAEAYLGSSG
jgi:branched-chain amino acid transport system ATP-binding protein